MDILYKVAMGEVVSDVVVVVDVVVGLELMTRRWLECRYYQ